ncbi:MAG: hydroxymethylpyrimidine/phosphomethylpyrimidine kinase [Verrucomicrobiota bacterium]
MQADLRVFATTGAYGCSAITCVVAEHPGHVGSFTPIPAKRVREQIDLVFEAYPVAAIKTGMLLKKKIAQEVVAAIREHGSEIPVVVDPVMMASTGAPLVEPGTMDVVREHLLPMATVVTPNRAETSWLAGKELRLRKEFEIAGRALARETGSAFLFKSVQKNGADSVDLLCHENKITVLRAPKIQGLDPHGTGCALSSAMASALASGLELPEACLAAKNFLHNALRNYLALGDYRVLNIQPTSSFNWKEMR